MYLVLCLHQKISKTCELQGDPIMRGYDSLVDNLLQSMSHMPMFYFCASVPYRAYTAMYMRLYCGSREIKSLNAAECYRVAQNKWDLRLKLFMGCFLIIKINYNGIVVSVCVFS